MYYGEPAEAQSIKSMYHIVRILAIVFGILLLLGGILYAVLVYSAWAACNSLVGGLGAYCSSGLGALLVWPLIVFIFGLVDIIVYVKMKELEALVNARQYEMAKQKTLVWMILGFVLGGIILGILLLIAYLKFDPLINSVRNQGQMGGGYPASGASMAYNAPPQGYAQPPQTYAQPQGYAQPPAYAPAPAYTAPPTPPPPAAPAAPPAPICPRCSKPTTYVPQYGRYYCYTDSVYV